MTYRVSSELPTVMALSTSNRDQKHQIYMKEALQIFSLGAKFSVANEVENRKR